MSIEPKALAGAQQCNHEPDYEKLYHTAINQLIDLHDQIADALLLLESMYLEQTEPDQLPVGGTERD